MTCPPLIELSQYIDAELDAATMLRIGQHLHACALCARSVAELESIAADRLAPAAVAGSDCPDAESLLAYLTSASPPQLDPHVGHCNHCVTTLQQLQRTLALMTEMPVAVPDSLRQRVAGPAPAAPVAARAQPVPSLWERLSSLWRYPVLMPASFAVGILIYVVALQLPTAPGLPASGSRAVSQPGSATRHVSVAEAIVYAERSAQAPVVAKLAHGNVVAVSTQEHGWYRVVVADGREGWIEERSLQ